MSAAKAAVSGDEKALDMFAWSKSNSAGKFGFTSSDTIQSIFGTVEGIFNSLLRCLRCKIYYFPLSVYLPPKGQEILASFFHNQSHKEGLNAEFETN